MDAQDRLAALTVGATLSLRRPSAPALRLWSPARSSKRKDCHNGRSSSVPPRMRSLKQMVIKTRSLQ